MSALSSGSEREPATADVPTSPVALDVAAVREGEAAGVKTVRGSALDVPPPGVGVTTVTWSVPVAAISVAGIIA